MAGHKSVRKKSAEEAILVSVTGSKRPVTMHSANFHDVLLTKSGPGSSVGIATELRAGRSGDRIPVGARFSAPGHTGPGAHSPSCTMGIGSFPGVNYGRGVLLTTRPLLVPWS
jgi:hypothetical protein